MNKTILIGRLGQDPEVRNGENTCTRVSLATKEKYRDKTGTAVENTEWHKVVFWGKVADTIGKWAMKGTHLLVEGKIKTRKYEKDGETKYITEVIGNSFEFLGGPRREQDGNQAQPQEQQTANTTAQDGPDDLPF